MDRTICHHLPRDVKKGRQILRAWHWRRHTKKKRKKKGEVLAFKCGSHFDEHK